VKKKHSIMYAEMRNTFRALTFMHLDFRIFYARALPILIAPTKLTCLVLPRSRRSDEIIPGSIPVPPIHSKSRGSGARLLTRADSPLSKRTTALHLPRTIGCFDRLRRGMSPNALSLITWKERPPDRWIRFPPMTNYWDWIRIPLDPDYNSALPARPRQIRQSLARGRGARCTRRATEVISCTTHAILCRPQSQVKFSPTMAAEDMLRAPQGSGCHIFAPPYLLPEAFFSTGVLDGRRGFIDRLDVLELFT